jgi:5-dehydro-4-deoxyglucarate dehydratase
MPSAMTPQELKAVVPRGMLSFPLTDFNADGEFDPKACARRLEWLSAYPSSALFMAGGAGEFFSLTPDEFSAVIGTAVQVCGGRTPIIAGTGYGTRTAIEYAQAAERLGADGLLLMPPYLVEASQEGLRAHITAICNATKLGVIVYNRANCRLATATTARLAADCQNLIGFKDGVGDLEQIAATRAAVGDRLIFINGMPTAETYAPAFKAAGVAAYSSAVFNFIPRTALKFLDAVQRNHSATIDALMRDFFVPYVRLRARQPGYAVSIVKAGAAIVGRGAGKVRPPLSDCTPEEVRDLKALIEKLGPQD